MKGKDFVVVGGNTGIGKVLIEKLTEAGATVHAIARKTDVLPSINGQTISWDVTEELPDLSALPDTLHGLAYLPGTINLKPFHRFKLSEIQHDLEVNVLGAVKISQALIKHFKKADPASLVFVSTVATKLGMPFHASVSMAKSAVEGLAKSIAAEYAPKIRANVVAPSLTDTPLADRLLATDDKKESSANRHPLKRYGNPDDIAGTLFYLLSDESSWMTGQVIGNDGGMGSVKLL